MAPVSVRPLVDRLHQLEAAVGRDLEEDRKGQERWLATMGPDQRTTFAASAGEIVSARSAAATALAALSREASELTSQTAQRVSDMARLTRDRALLDRSAAPVLPTTTTKSDLVRVSEDVRVGRLEVESLDGEVTDAKVDVSGAITRRDEASRAARAEGSPLVRLGDALRGLIGRSPRDANPALAWLMERHQSVSTLATHVLEARDAVANAAVDAANARLDLVRVRHSLASARLDRARALLELYRRRVGITAQDVSQATAVSRQQTVQADELRRQAAKVSAQAATEREEAHKVQERAQRRDEQLQQAAQRGEEEDVLALRKRVLAEELQLAEDRAGLATARQRLADAVAHTADARISMAAELVSETQRLARAVSRAMQRGGDRSGVRDCIDSMEKARRNLRKTYRELTEEKSTHGVAVVQHHRRRTVARERHDRESTAAKGSTQKSLWADLLRILKDNELVAGEREDIAARHAALLDQRLSLIDEMAKFYEDSLTALEPYRDRLVTTSTLRTAGFALWMALRQTPAVVAASPGELRVWWSSRGHQSWFFERAGVLGLWLILMVALVSAARWALVTWLPGAGVWGARSAEVLVEALPALGSAGAVWMSLGGSTQGGPWPSVFGTLLGYLGAYRLGMGWLALVVLGPTGRRSTDPRPARPSADDLDPAHPEAPGPGPLMISESPPETGALPDRRMGGGDWLWPWIAAGFRFGIAFWFVIDLAGIAGARPELVLGLATLQRLGLLALALSALLVHRRRLLDAVPRGRALLENDEPSRGRMVDRIYGLVCLGVLVIGGLRIAGHDQQADQVQNALLGSAASLWIALKLYRAMKASASDSSTDADVMSGTLSLWAQRLVGLVLGLMTSLVWVKLWAPKVSLGRILTSAPVLDLAGRLLGVSGVMLVAVALSRTATGAIELLFEAMTRTSGAAEADRRSRTLQPLLVSLVRYSLFFVAGVLALQQAGFDPTPLLAGAGVLGVAVGFGAQSLVKDVITGFFIIVEDLISVGDWVDIDGRVGQVEAITIRTTQLRFYSGELRTIPNGEIRQIGNHNRGFMRAVVRVGVAYEADAEAAMAMLRTMARTIHDRYRDWMLGPPEVHGPLELASSEVSLRAVFVVKAGHHLEVERAMRLAIKQGFAEAGLEIPYARQVIYWRKDAHADDTLDERPKVSPTKSSGDPSTGSGS